MIDLRATGDCVGQVGISHGPRYPEKELGWLVYEGHEGRGYATEAGRRSGLGPDLGSTRSYIDPEISVDRVAERFAALDPRPKRS